MEALAEAVNVAKEAVKAQGSVVRELSKSGVSKEEKKPAVDELLALKAVLKAAEAEVKAFKKSKASVEAEAIAKKKKAKADAKKAAKKSKQKQQQAFKGVENVQGGALPMIDHLMAEVTNFSGASGASSQRVSVGVASTVDEKMHYITRNLQEVMGAEKSITKLEKLLHERDLKLYWGTATTGKPHVAYFVPMSKIADFLRAGCHVTILFADLHAYLDNMKAPWELLRLRTEYYQNVIQGMLEAIGVPLDKLKFVQGTSFQLAQDYTLDMYKLSSLVTLRNAQKAGAEVVKQASTPPVSGLLYPLLQGLDEQYLGVDAQFGGVDQRKIFTFAETYLPKIGYKKRFHFMNPMVPGLTGGKMSSSEANSKIDLLDTEEEVERKIKGAFCEEGNIQENGPLSFVKMVLFQVFPTFVIDRPVEHGGVLSYTKFEDLEKDFAEKNIHPADLKRAVAAQLNELLEPVRQKFDTPELQKLTALAYPEEVKGWVAPVSAEVAAQAGDVQPEAATPKPTQKKQGSTKGSRKKQSKKKQKKHSQKKGSHKGKKGGKGKGGKAPPSEGIAKLDIRVAQIIKVEPVPESDSLYVETIDVGEAAPRQVVSGLAKVYTLEQMQGRRLLLLCNMKPAKLRGVMSHAMVLCASADGVTELLEPPEGAKIGERVTFEGCSSVHDIEPRCNDKQRGKVMVDLQTNADRVAAFQNIPMMTSAGPVTAPSLSNTAIC